MKVDFHRAARWATVAWSCLLFCGSVGISAEDPAGPKEEPTAKQQSEESPAKDAGTFAVATYNINWGNVDLRKTVAVIRKAQADLVLLQETNLQSERYLRGQFKEVYRHIAFQGYRGQYGAERFGVLSKSPLTGLRFLRPKHGLFGTLIGQTEIVGRKLQIVNVHLQPVMLDAKLGVSGAFRALSSAEDTHRAEIEYVLENLTPDLPTLIAGDFNSMSAFVAPKRLVEKGLTDSFASVTATPDIHRTWHWPVGSTEISGRIDYIFHTRHLRTLESRILDGESSDHLLVVSRLAWQSDATERK